MTLAESLIERGLELARGEALAELELANTTPALVGGWRGHSLTDPRRCLVEPARPTDIAGKMRWWLRSILAAGYYELHGVHLPLYLADRLAATIMGDTREASKITLRIQPLNTPCRWGELPIGKPADIRQVLLERARSSGSSLIKRLAELCNDSLDVNACFAAALLSPRVLLQLLGAQDDPDRAAGLIPLPPGCYRFRLTVHERPHAKWDSESLREAALRVAGTALGMALFFTGIGRMVTRGYGKLAPLNHIDEGSPLAQSLAETWSQLTACNGPLHVAHRAVREAVDYLQQLEACHGCRRPVVRPHELEAALHRDEATTSLPLNPTLHPDYITVRSTDRATLTIPGSCTKIDCDSNPWCVVAALSQAATATTLRCTLQDAPCYTPMHLLGLPRGSRGSGSGDGRGYVCMYIGGDKGRASDRMLSLIQMTPVYRPSMSDFECNAMYVVHVLGFKTMFLNLLSERYPKYYKCKILHYNGCYNMGISIFDEVDQQLINGMRNLSIYDNNTKSINIDRFIDFILKVIS